MIVGNILVWSYFQPRLHGFVVLAVAIVRLTFGLEIRNKCSRNDMFNLLDANKKQDVIVVP